MALAAGVAVTGLGVGAATAADGDLDTGFGQAGMVSTAVGVNGVREQMSAVAVQDDGRIVVAGSIDMGRATLFDMGVIRYLPDGRLDPGFGFDGVVITAVSPGRLDDRAEDVLVAPNGTITVVGGAEMAATGADIAVVRYRANGSLDRSFGGDGIVTTSVAPSGDTETAVAAALQADGRLVVVANRVDADRDRHINVARYGVDGSLDTRFGVGGVVTLPIGGPDEGESAVDVAVQSDGRIVVAGVAHDANGFTTDSLVVRLLANGSFDPRFGTAGVARVDVSPLSAIRGATSLAIDQSGRIVMAGSGRFPSTNTDPVVVRFSTRGVLDRSFGVDGIVTLPMGSSSSSDVASGVEIQSDGRIVIAGDTFSEQTQKDVLVARLDANGALDPTFHGDGIVTTTSASSRSGSEGAADLDIARNGRIVVAGSTLWSGATLEDPFVVRYQAMSTLRRGATMGVARLLREPVPGGSTIELSRPRASRRACHIVRQRVEALAPGRCEVRVRVTLPAVGDAARVTRRMKVVLSVVR